MGDPATPRAERQVRALMSAILETAVDGIITIDDRGNVESVNPSALRMFGYTEEEVLGRNVSMLMPSPHREKHDAYLSAYADTGVPKIIGIGRQVMGRRKDGTLFPVDLAVSEVAVGDRRLFAGFLRDITELKRAEEALRRERDFAESLIDTLQAIVLVLDLDGRIVRFNQYMEELSGYRLEEVRGRDWFATFLPRAAQGQTRALFRRAVTGTRTRGNINPIVTKDGRERYVAWWDKMMEDAEGNEVGLLSVGHDVTELKDAQEKLLQTERLAGIGQMITGLAHESRNALQRMQACLEMLALEVEDRPAAMDYVGRIQKAQDYLGQLYEEVRNYAAPIHLDRKACDLRRLWGAAWADLELTRRGRPFELLDETAGTDLTCRVDPFAFGQVFRNILDNAIDACPEGGQIAFSCEEAEEQGRPAVRLTICDSGGGVSPEQARRMFQPFFTTKTKGTGIGLAIVRRILEAHGGRIDVGKGRLPGAALVLTVPRGPV